MKEFLLQLFGDNKCSFGQAMLEFALIGLGFLLLGSVLRSIFRKNYKKVSIDLERDLRATRLDKKTLQSEVNNLNDKLHNAQNQLRAFKKS